MQIQLFSSNITCTRNQTSLPNTSTSNIFQQWQVLRGKLQRMVLLSLLPNPPNPHHPADSLPPLLPSTPLLPGWLQRPQVYLHLLAKPPISPPMPQMTMPSWGIQPWRKLTTKRKKTKTKTVNLPPMKISTKSNFFDSDDDNVSLGLSEYRVPSAWGVGSG